MAEDSEKFLVPGIIAALGDIGFLLAIVFGVIASLTGVLLPLGIFLILGGVFWHYATGAMVLFMSLSKLPKNSMMQKIVVIMNPRFWIILTTIVPLPLLLLGIILAVIMQNKIAQMLVEQALILGLAAATGGAGLAAEGAAVGGEVAAEGAAVAATEGAAVGGEVAAEGATKETIGQAAKRKGKEFLEERIKEKLEEAPGEEEEEPESPEDQELEDIMSGDPFGRHIMRAMSAEDMLATIGEGGGKEAGQEMSPKKGPEWAQRNDRGAKGIIRGEEVDLRGSKNKEIL